MTKINRRRFITITAAAAGLGLVVPLGAKASVANVPVYRWEGTALGAKGSILLAHKSEEEAEKLIRAALDEIRRLEKVFSLYQKDSALTALNRDGVLEEAPLDMVRLLNESHYFSEASNGAFDVTVQPLWKALEKSAAEKFTPAERDKALREATAKVDYQKVHIEDDGAVFMESGMGITFNGIAQGYITDRVADLLRRNGMDNVMVHLGETRALGKHPNGRPWKVGIPNPKSPEAIIETIELTNKALATSGAYGTEIDKEAGINHLFDPKTGKSSHLYGSVSVVASRATTADALSTALSNMPLDQAKILLEKIGGVEAHFILPDGAVRILKG